MKQSYNEVKNYSRSIVVSVVIPTYNRADTISEAIDSVLTQTYDNFEIILIDDGSTDNTKETIARYGEKITYIYQNNSGPSSARNRGIRQAKGEFIAFLDSDDAWLPEKLEKQLKCLSENPSLCLIGTGYYNCDENMRTPTKPKKMRLAKNKQDEILIRNLWPTPSLIIRRSCFDVVGMFNEEMRFAEDWDMWIRITQAFPTATIDEPLVLIRNHQQSLSSPTAKKCYNYNLWLKLIQCNKRKFSRMGWITYKKAMSFYFLNLAYNCQVCGDFAGNRRYLLASIICWPFYSPRRIVVLMKKYVAVIFHMLKLRV